MIGKTFDVIIFQSEQLNCVVRDKQAHLHIARKFSNQRPGKSSTSAHTEIGTCTIVGDDTVTTVKSATTGSCSARVFCRPVSHAIGTVEKDEPGAEKRYSARVATHTVH